MQNRKAMKARRLQRKKQQRVTSILVIIGVALILSAFLMLPTIRQSVAPLGDFIQPDLNPRPMAVGNAMGDPNAPVVIHEYSDFGCSHCFTFSSGAGEEIAEAYVASGQVYFVYHSVGNMLSPISAEITEAAYCAGDQGKFWEFHDIVFENQITLFSNANLPLDKYMMAFGEALTLEPDEFASCNDSGKYASQVQQDRVDAQAAGINSTPSFLVNGTLLVGAQPFSEFEAVNEAILLEQ
ncbi:MAG: thioredoxin domain-containing protein [Chloroflexi bacterium]|nr:thioredoxin domain-containing protein [Chloroflexota bacterium]